MFKRWRALMALVAVLALVAAACGDGDGSDDTSTTTTTVADTTTTTMADTTTTTASTDETTTTTAPPVVRADADLVIWTDAQRQPVLENIGALFAQATGVTVAVQEVQDVRARFETADPLGEGPDVIIGAHDWLGGLVASGVVQPIDISAVADNFPPVAVNAFTYEGRTYGLPYAIENIALVRNTDLVPDSPATWEEMEQIALDLVNNAAPATTKRGQSGVVDTPIAWQQNGSADPYHNYPVFTALGGYVFGSPETGYDPSDVGIDSPGALAAADKYAEMADAGLVNIDITYDIMIEKFANGQAPFAITGPWAVGDFSDVNFVVEPIPPVEGGTPQVFVGVQGAMLANNAQNPLVAQSFILDALSRADAQLALFQTDGRPPAHLDVFSQIAGDPVIQGFAASGQNGVPMPAIPEMGNVWDDWTNAYQAVFTGTTDPETAFKDAAANIRNLIAGS